MRVLVITSCTGEKAVEHERQLTLADFQKGPEHVGQREAELGDLLMPAEELYTGQQHVRLMRGVKQFRERNAGQLDLFVLSAGYGLVPGDRKLAPYEATFAGMSKKELRRWADALDVPAQVRRVLAEPYDLALILLGDSYLEACGLNERLVLGGPTLLFCGTGTKKRLPPLQQLKVVTLSNAEAKRFRCGLLSLKGELAARLLKAQQIQGLTLDTETTLFTILDSQDDKQSNPLTTLSAPDGSELDKTIDIPEEWWGLPHRKRLMYFIPDWDDLVDPKFDFTSDMHSFETGNWANQVYSHQLYPTPNYDGLLVSKVVIEKSNKLKRQRIEQMGIHRYLRVPERMPIMGDCGAFGYIDQPTPPYQTGEIVDYYSRLGFDYGVSIDHLIVTATESERDYRYEITINNAEEFLKHHRSSGANWVPIGAVQGWDPKSYARAAADYVKMGYNYIALGGLVRTGTPEIMRILRAVHDVVPTSVKIHLFGLARLEAVNECVELGVSSIDSASFLRRAWLGSNRNYLTTNAEWYAAIRIPSADSFRAKRMVSEGRVDGDRARRLEQDAIRALLQFEKGDASVDGVLNVIMELDQLITDGRRDNRADLRRTLEDRPWRECACPICRAIGVQVIIFRGNNRNRRRGFHNTYAFYNVLQRVLNGQLDISSFADQTSRQLSFLDDLVGE